MAEETEKTTEELETETTETEEKTAEDSRESVIDKIKEKVSSFFSGDKEEEAETVEVPPDFAKAVKELGWSDEDLADFTKDYTVEELEEMIPALLGEDTDEGSDETSEKEEEKTKEGKEQKAEKKQVEKSQEDERIQKLLDRIEALEKAQGKSKEDDKQRELVNLVSKASQTFDEASKEFEVFGKTEDLPKFPDGRVIPTSPQMKARSKVWDMAYRLQSTGLDFDNAMSTALNAFKGENLAKDIHRKVVKELKDKEKRLGGKRTSHESSTNVATGADVIRQVARKHGRDIL